jgi:alpha-beta hydrolase superfamily lysophospholipase
MPDIYERSWPVAGAKGAVAIVHGLGEHSGRYDYVASALNKAGYSAYAMDVRGHGQSVGFPHDMGTDLNQLVTDVVEFCVGVRESYAKTFLLAHSMGTLLSMPAVPRVPEGTLSGLVLSGTATEPGPAGGDLFTKGAVPLEALSRDPAVQEAYESDPLVWKEVPSHIFDHLIELGGLVQQAIPLIEIPVLLIHGKDDPLTNISGASAVYSELVIADKTLLGYDNLRHEILNEPERDTVIADVVNWLDKH